MYECQVNNKSRERMQEMAYEAVHRWEERLWIKWHWDKPAKIITWSFKLWLWVVTNVTFNFNLVNNIYIYKIQPMNRWLRSSSESQESYHFNANSMGTCTSILVLSLVSKGWYNVDALVTWYIHKENIILGNGQVMGYCN